MAIRPIYIPLLSPPSGALEKNIDFKWYPGMALVQKQKTISAMHSVAKEQGITPILEISSKSPDELGVKLSAFNLIITTKIQKNHFQWRQLFKEAKFLKKEAHLLNYLMVPCVLQKKIQGLEPQGTSLNLTFMVRISQVNQELSFMTGYILMHLCKMKNYLLIY